MNKKLSRFWAICTASLCFTMVACTSVTTPVSRLPFSSKSSNDLSHVTAECVLPKIEYEDVSMAFNLEADLPMWKVGYFVDKPPRYALTEFIREGDDINNWRELLTVQNFAANSWGLSSPEETLNALMAAREQRCPGATRWNVIEKSADSILYEWQATTCQGWPDQHEIAKITYGKYNRFSYHYVAKRYQLPVDTRSKWIKTFAESTIVLRCR